MKVNGLICDKIARFFLLITIFLQRIVALFLEWSLKKQKEKKGTFCWFNFVSKDWPEEENLLAEVINIDMQFVIISTVTCVSSLRRELKIETCACICWEGFMPKTQLRKDELVIELIW